MTRREKSDAQLDAEAEARRRGLEPPAHDHGMDDPDAYDVPRFPSSPKPKAAASPAGIAALILYHRARFRDDLHIPRLVSRQPPTSIDSNTGVMDEEPAAATGMSMSGRMLRYVSGDYGSGFPWSKAFWLLKVNCRRNHPHHRSADRPYWRGALCYQAVKLVVVGGEANGVGPLTAEQAGQVLRIDQIDQLLVSAFRFIVDAVDDFRDRAVKRAREDAGQFTIYDHAPVHHAPSHDHIAECPNPECRARRNAA